MTWVSPRITLDLFQLPVVIKRVIVSVAGNLAALSGMTWCACWIGVQPKDNFCGITRKHFIVEKLLFLSLLLAFYE